MRAFLPFVVVLGMSATTLSDTLPAPQAITDPKQVASKPNAQVEKNLSIEKLYMTRYVGGTSWSPDNLPYRCKGGTGAGVGTIVSLAQELAREE